MDVFLVYMRSPVEMNRRGNQLFFERGTAMAQNAKKPQSINAVETVEQTYEFEGRVLTQAEILSVLTPCGHERFVEIDRANAKISVPYGTLADKMNPLRPIRSLEAQEREHQLRRQSEGHKMSKMPARFAVHSNGSTPGS
jgi:hypothetical protein